MPLHQLSIWWENRHWVCIWTIDFKHVIFVSHRLLEQDTMLMYDVSPIIYPPLYFKSYTLEYWSVNSAIPNLACLFRFSHQHKDWMWVRNFHHLSPWEKPSVIVNSPHPLPFHPLPSPQRLLRLHWSEESRQRISKQINLGHNPSLLSGVVKMFANVQSLIPHIEVTLCEWMITPNDLSGTCGKW